MPINKLEQLRKYIFDIEMERIQSVSRGNQLPVGFFDKKKSQKGYVAAILKGLRSAPK